MSYFLVVTRQAENDIEEFFHWYEDQAEGLGHAFLAAARTAAQQAASRPLSFAEVEEETRRVLLNKFPYSLFFLVHGERVVVTACVHQRRDPEVWRSRG